MTSRSNPNDESNNQDGGDWGWEPLGSEDGDEPDTARSGGPSIPKQDSTEESESKPKRTASGSSEKNLPSPSARKVGSHGSFSSKPMKGIVSSPSFQELEKAIGATLSLASNDSGELTEGRTMTRSTSGTIPARLSSTNLTQQKVNQQRLRQQQHHQQNQRHQGQSQYSRSPHAAGYAAYSAAPQMMYGPTIPAPLAIPMPPSPVLPARVELAPYINEAESRAIILFHSVHVSAVDIRNACSKHGVLYYIRPEFHGRGVTLLSYFDLRCATAAKACLAEDLGRAAEASAHYSVMLHAANGNSEEFRLVVRHLPVDRCAEGEVQAIFERYGQLRSIQKTFDDDGVTTPRTEGSISNGMVASTGSTVEDGVVKETSPGSDDDGGDSSASTSSKIAYTVEYYNIQDARLAASELSATSAQLWNAEVTVRLALLDERKQQLCRQLLATLSRWRTEMAAAASYNMSIQQQQQQQQVRPQFVPVGMMAQAGGPGAGYGAYPPVGMGMGMGGAGMQMMGPPSAYAVPGSPHGVSMLQMGPAGDAGAIMGSLPYFDQQQFQAQQMHQPQMGYGTMQPVFPGQGALQPQIQQQAPPMLVPAFPISPMHSALLPGTNLSNPNLFNLGLLAAQAEAQMQQQREQQQAQQQYQSSPASPEPRQQDPPAGSDSASGSDAASPDVGSMHQHRGGQRPTPPHHNGGHPAAGSQQFSSTTNAPRPLAPLHHHHQHTAHAMAQQYAPPQPYYPGNLYQLGQPAGALNGYHHQQQHQQQPGQQRRGRGGPGSGAAGSNSGGSGTGGGHQIDADFALDLRRLSEDTETRTTVMVRNIPNKYNQQMLLDEVNAHHEGTYDFFYLPIDFKNKCNVGYCFINFLEPRFIAPFVRTFNGQRWRSFNSEKVCAVSFARIQGKQAMIARFQNSSLLEKEDEYRPLLFYSSGPDRGKPEPFPVGGGVAGRNRQHSLSSRPSSVSPGPHALAPSPGPRGQAGQQGAGEDGSAKANGGGNSNRGSPVENAAT